MRHIYNNIRDYYTNKIQKYGPTPKGVDWNGEKGQFIRFEQLSKIITSNNFFSIGDLGCGYGKYFEFLKDRFSNFEYIGYDLSNEMIINARKLYSNREGKFLVIKSYNDIKTDDYLVASGIFNVKNKISEGEWLYYILKTIETMNEKSRKGFAFNILTKYSDKEYMKDYLYYADPLFLFDYCKRNFSKNIALLHDYDLYEFTILVKKEK